MLGTKYELGECLRDVAKWIHVSDPREPGTACLIQTELGKGGPESILHTWILAALLSLDYNVRVPAHPHLLCL